MATMVGSDPHLQVKSAGFEFVEGWKLTDNPESLTLCRGLVRGMKRV